jgi:hypothetical protein
MRAPLVFTFSLQGLAFRICMTVASSGCMSCSVGDGGQTGAPLAPHPPTQGLALRSLLLLHESGQQKKRKFLTASCGFKSGLDSLS